MEHEPKPQEKFDVDEIRMLQEIARKRLGYKMMDQVAAFAGHLKELYPDWQRRRAYHALAESTIPPEYEEGMIEEDFPGTDSVLEFVKSLAISGHK